MTSWWFPIASSPAGTGKNGDGESSFVHVAAPTHSRDLCLGPNPSAAAAVTHSGVSLATDGFFTGRNWRLSFVFMQQKRLKHSFGVWRFGLLATEFAASKTNFNTYVCQCVYKPAEQSTYLTTFASSYYIPGLPAQVALLQIPIQNVIQEIRTNSGVSWSVRSFRTPNPQISYPDFWTCKSQLRCQESLLPQGSPQAPPWRLHGTSGAKDTRPCPFSGRWAYAPRDPLHSTPFEFERPWLVKEIWWKQGEISSWLAHLEVPPGSPGTGSESPVTFWGTVSPPVFGDQSWSRARPCSLSCKLAKWAQKFWTQGDTDTVDDGWRSKM